MKMTTLNYAYCSTAAATTEVTMIPTRRCVNLTRLHRLWPSTCGSPELGEMRRRGEQEQEGRSRF